jgi:serine/threonine-protein kinase RsbT
MNSPYLNGDALAHIMPLQTGEDVVRLRQALRERVLSIKLSLVDQTKFVTAASELARNVLDYGGGGEAHLYLVEKDSKRGVQVVFIDQGPGIADVDQALSDGFTSGGGMGLGLGGAKRLSDEFYLETAVGHGTKITIIKWKAF